MPEKTNPETTDVSRLSGVPDVPRLLGALGLCARAKGLTFGTEMVCEAIRSATPPRLVIEASDTSANTHKKLCDKCTYYSVRIERVPVRGEDLAAAVGKRAPVAALAVRDEHLCRLVASTIAPQTEDRK